MLVIYNEEVVDHLEVLGVLTQVDKRFFNSTLLREREHFVGHNATRGLCSIAQQFANGPRLVGWHQAQKTFGLFLWDLRQYIGGGIRPEVLKQVGSPFPVHFAHHLVLPWGLYVS